MIELERPEDGDERMEDQSGMPERRQEHSPLRKIGAHLSTAGGPQTAVERIAAMGGTCLQIFAGSPRLWKRQPLKPDVFEKTLEARRTFAVSPVFIHASYLINLASEDAEIFGKSVESLVYDMAFNAGIEGAGVIVHLGSHTGRGWEAVKDDTVRAVAAILERSPASSHFIIENSAGQQGKLCSDLCDIRWLMDRLADERVTWCVDTCHAFAAGYHLSPACSLTGKNERGLLSDDIERYGLWETLSLVHVNDSRDPFGSGRDRHANLGDGIIPTGDLSWFLNRPQLEEVPLILEVPGLDDEGPDEENIRRLRSLFA